MKLEDFEHRLERQPLRPVPPPWREEMLHAANAVAARRSGLRETEPASWWREWLWPNPATWAGLAGAWAVITVLNLASVSRSEKGVAPAIPLAPQTLALLREQRQLLAELVHPSPAPAEPPKTPALRPRSQRVVRVVIV